MASNPKHISEPEAMGAIEDALLKLQDDDSRGRVLDWAISKFGGSQHRRSPRGEVVREVRDERSGGADLRNEDPGAPEEPGFGSRATVWLKKYKISRSMIDAVFHIDGDDGALILKTVPGKSKRERLPNVAALLGAMKLLQTDQPKFNSSELREVLKSYDAYDRPNNSTYVKAFKNVIQGSGTEGYSITAVGLEIAANIISGTSEED